MGMKIFDWIFEGPNSIESTEIPAGRAGIYVIIDRQTSGNYVMDVGQSGDAACRLANHDRRGCWESHKRGQLEAYILLTPSSEGWNKESRCALESKIRDQYTPTCGKR